uniref:Apple domain-containing protein n=1 Tax=Pinctada fucata TaxID=50426 RepID=A0A194ANQ8_PINFU
MYSHITEYQDVRKIGRETLIFTMKISEIVSFGFSLFMLSKWAMGQTIYGSTCKETLIRQVSALQKRLEALESHIAQACDKTAGYRDTFTENMNKLHAGRDITWKYTRPGTRKEKLKECEELCLSYTQCKAYELHLYDGRCSIEAINKYDVPLESHSSYVYYNRDYDCGCVPCKANTIRESPNGTEVGSVGFCRSTVNGMKSTYECTPSGWKLK